MAIETLWATHVLDAQSALEISKGIREGHTSVNKYGYALDGIQTTPTDMWDRADAAETQKVWAAPQQSIHTLVSTSGLDDGSPAGVGAQTIRIYGLTDWDTAEIYEDIIMDGATGVDTVNQYVIIHRMKVLTYGSLGPNIGVITATSVSGTGVVTAQINAQEGQTQMAIYGIPSTQTAYMTNWYASIHKSSGVAADVLFKILFAPDVSSVTSTSRFVVKESRGLQSTGSSTATWGKDPYKKFVGPGVLKIQAVASAADVDGAAGFDLIMVDN